MFNQRFTRKFNTVIVDGQQEGDKITLKARIQGAANINSYKVVYNNTQQLSQDLAIIFQTTKKLFDSIKDNNFCQIDILDGSLWIQAFIINAKKRFRLRTEIIGINLQSQNKQFIKNNVKCQINEEQLLIDIVRNEETIRCLNLTGNKMPKQFKCIFRNTKHIYQTIEKSDQCEIYTQNDCVYLSLYILRSIKCYKFKKGQISQLPIQQRQQLQTSRVDLASSQYSMSSTGLTIENEDNLQQFLESLKQQKQLNQKLKQQEEKLSEDCQNLKNQYQKNQKNCYVCGNQITCAAFQFVEKPVPIVVHIPAPQLVKRKKQQLQEQQQQYKQNIQEQERQIEQHIKNLTKAEIKANLMKSGIYVSSDEEQIAKQSHSKQKGQEEEQKGESRIEQGEIKDYCQSMIENQEQKDVFENISLQSITIKDNMDIQTLITKLKFLQFLTTLRLQCFALCTKQSLLKIMKYFPNIRNLYINCLDNQFDQECVQLVKQIGYQFLNYGLDLSQGWVYQLQANKFQSQTFRKPLNNQTIIKLVQNCPKLRNVWISDQNILNKVLSYHKWQHLSFGCCQIKNLSIESWQLLAVPQQLITLSLYNIDDLNNQKIDKLLECNSTTLKSLMLKCCSGVQDAGLIKLQSCSQINSIYLDLQNSLLKGECLIGLQKLVNLHIEHCSNLSNSLLQKSFQLSKKIEHLSLCHCEAIDNEVIRKLVKLQKLNSIILIDNVSLSELGLNQITEDLVQLRTLHVGQNKIDSEMVVQVITGLINLQKLGFSNLTINGDQLIKTGKRLTKVIQLDLNGCKFIDAKHLTDKSVFPKLKSVKITNSTINGQELSAVRNELTLIQ